MAYIVISLTSNSEDSAFERYHALCSEIHYGEDNDRQVLLVVNNEIQGRVEQVLSDVEEYGDTRLNVF